MCENAYLSIKNPKASRALKQALDTGCRMLASLVRLRFATSATFGLRSWGPPLDQILDPHLRVSLQNSLLPDFVGPVPTWSNDLKTITFQLIPYCKVLCKNYNAFLQQECTTLMDPSQATKLLQTKKFTSAWTRTRQIGIKLIVWQRL